MSNAKFEVGMVIPAWSPKVGVNGSNGSALVVAISPDRRYIWLVDEDKAETTKLGAQREDIVYDARFGEKVVSFPNFLHRTFLVYRADKATGRAEVPSHLVPSEAIPA